MATPTISIVSPNRGETTGRNLIEIVGTGFSAPAPGSLPPPIVASKPPPTMRVFFGSEEATSVMVYSETQLTCIAPSGVTGSVDVRVENLDAAGVMVPGEFAVKANAYQYGMPSYLKEGILQLTVRTLLLEMQKQIMPNVRWKTQVEYDERPDTERVDPAKLPSLTIVGPTTPENRFYSVNGTHTVVGTDGAVRSFRSPYTIDLHFTLVCETNNSMLLLNLWQAVQAFFHENKYLTVKNVSDAVNAGVEKYEMDLLRPGLRNTGVHSADNLQRFSGSFEIRGVNVYGRAGSTLGGMVGTTASADEIDIEIEP